LEFISDLFFEICKILFSEEVIMWRCTVCGYIYDDAKEGKKFEDLPDDWTCPVCNAPKDAFVRV
jgi:rubredoxin